MKVRVHFLGAAGTVTGSKILVETPSHNILVDCGLFQGLKELRNLNWQPLDFAADKIDLVLLTHGHLDHTGYLPRLVKEGFRGHIMGTAPTLDISSIILRDCGKIQEEDTERANEQAYTVHFPALPLYTVEDAEYTIRKFKPVAAGVWINLFSDIRVRFQSNGHIIGSCFIELEIHGSIFVFSGDVGRQNDNLLKAPLRPEKADYLFLESTYGNRLHQGEDPEITLAEAVKTCIAKTGNLIIPSFAVERMQTLMYLLWKLMKQNKIPEIPVIIDSPMGNEVTKVFAEHPKWHSLSKEDLDAINRQFFTVTSYAQTWSIIEDPRMKIIIAGSGMVTGGRVLTYLAHFIDNPLTTVLLAGYQAEGTRGRQLQEGASEIKIFGKYFPVHAEILNLHTISAHADQQELLDWVSQVKNPPRNVFLVHGEPTASDALRVKIKDTYHWPVRIPRLGELIEVHL